MAIFGTVSNVIHSKQALPASELEHGASKLEKCNSWFSIRNDHCPPTHHSKCVMFTNKKMANLRCTLKANCTGQNWSSRGWRRAKSRSGKDLRWSLMLQDDIDVTQCRNIIMQFTYFLWVPRLVAIIVNMALMVKVLHVMCIHDTQYVHEVKEIDPLR